MELFQFGAYELVCKLSSYLCILFDNRNTRKRAPKVTGSCKIVQFIVNCFFIQFDKINNIITMTSILISIFR